MKTFITLSDIHVRNSSDERYCSLLKFIKYADENEIDGVFLLGDIFDLMVGGSEDFFTEYNSFFLKLGDLLNKGVKVFYLEGNHDFHLKDSFERFFKINDYRAENFIFSEAEIIRKIDGRFFFFSHGDKLDIENKSYQRFRKIIRNSFVGLLAKNFFSKKTIDFLGKLLSNNSHRGKARPVDLVEEKNRFLRYANLIWSFGISSILLGHSHILETVELNGKTYHNNGYFPVTKKFILYKNQKFSFVDLV